MSLKDVQVAVENFLKLDRPQAIAISGQWGSGKTYFWNQVIKDASSKGLVKKYSYVSLFGTSNLAELKSAIFDNAVSAKDVDAGASSLTWAENAKEVMRSSSIEEVKAPGRRLLNFSRKNISQVTPLLGVWGSVARSLSYFAIKDYVICLDDIERKGAELPLKEILGLVSMLKEQRGCRIAAILNMDELEGDKVTLDALKEKVFDGEIVFSPSAEECAKLVFTDEWKHSREVAGKVISLGIKNIRIMQRIRWVIETLLPYVNDKDIALTRQLIHSSVLLTWCYYSRGTGIPSYDFVKSDGFAVWGIAKAGKEGEQSKEDKFVEKVMYDYGYSGSDEFDLHICKFLEQGYVVEKDFVEVVDSFQEMALKNNHDGSFTQAWELFHDTFSNNEKELVETLRKRFMEDAKWISLGNAMATVKLMRELERDDVGDELMLCWIEMAKKENKDLLDLRHAHLFSGSIDEKFKDAVKHAYVEDRALPALGETIIDISVKSGWGVDQIEVMSQASSDDYYTFFISIKGDRHLGAYVKACLQFGGYKDDERYQKIYAAASEALRRIAAESHLNAVRVSRFLPKDEG
ncbi:P-loop NTPase fold protein [Rhodanobacter sp. OK091]|uniref:P-loop NTPase fold protein n=1 Tax=Rhodanobacter sp. OK091 TaxID=1881037 RepID=UPI00091EE095|nr:P-loop NTPase fold protein [Rhodanobacter sp. OK091]SHL58264.1 KAP family P-loop domain-containing protein [Rhodanobacter sp. OK091]